MQKILPLSVFLWMLLLYSNGAALEAVAQSPLSQGGAGQVVIMETKIKNLKSQTVTLQENLSILEDSVVKLEECGSKGGLWNKETATCKIPETTPSPSKGDDGRDGVGDFKNILKCNAKGMFYDPNHTGADADGCFCGGECSEASS